MLRTCRAPFAAALSTSLPTNSSSPYSHWTRKIGLWTTNFRQTNIRYNIISYMVYLCFFIGVDYRTYDSPRTHMALHKVPR